MSFNFLNKLSSQRRVSGITTSESVLTVTAQTGGTSATPGDGYTYYTWSAPSTGSSSGPVTFGNGTPTPPEYPSVKSRSITGGTVTASGDAYVECHGGSRGPVGGKATATFTAATLTSSPNFYVDISAGGSPGGGSHAGFFVTSKTFANTYLIAGGAGSPAPATGNSGGAGGGTNAGGGNPGPPSGGPGPSQGGGGATQAGAGGGGRGAPDRCSGQSGGQLSGGPLGGGDPSGRPGGGGGSGYYGGGAGGCGYSGDNNNPGGGGGGGSGYVHPSAQGGTNQTGSSQSGTRVVVRVLA